MRVVSLLPAATEIVAALGMLDQLVGVSHECDYPAEVQAKPRVTHCAIHGGALGVPEHAAEVIAGLEARIAAVRARVAGAPRRRCVVLEWIAPPYRSGHWTPELVALAGGTEPLGRMGEDAARVAWEAVVAAAPDVLVLACCGYDLARTMADVPLLRARPGCGQLPAVRAGQGYAVDGSAYFSRPGPRLVDSLEMLAEILHPELFAGRFPARAVRRLAPHELVGG